MNKILVTGALGNVGAEIVKQLQREGQAVRAADLSVEKIRQRFGDSVEAAPFDFSQEQTFTPALESVKRMFLMRPPHITDVKRYILPFLAAAQTAEVEQVVFLSLIGIEQNKRVPHYQIEQYLRSSSIHWTFLRASFFMQNLSSTHRREIQERSEVFVPVGRGKTSFIDVRDIAAVAVVALTQSGHENQAYDLTGPAALDYYEVAKILGEGLGRKINYRDPSLLSFLWQTVRDGAHLPFALVMAYLYIQTRRGMSAFTTDEVERLLGRSPISLRQFVEDNREMWLV